MFSFELRVSGFSETNWMETLRIRDRMPNVLFDREHRIRFSLSVLPSAIGDSSMANMMDEQETCPCLFCCTLTSWSRSLPCLSARGASASSLAAPKVGTSFRATYGENVSCFLVDSAAWNVFSAVTSEVRRVSVCFDEHPLVQPCRHRGRSPRRSWSLRSKHTFQIFHCRGVYLLLEADADLYLFLSGAPHVHAE